MSRVRDHEVKIWMSDEEIEEMEKRMKEMDVRNRGAFIRKMILNGYCLRLDIPEIRTMTTQLKHCGNNLNQYARKANQTGSIYEEDIRDLRKRLDQIYDSTEKILIRLNALQ